MGSCLHGATGPFRSLLQHGLLSMESQPPSGIPLLWHGVLHWLLHHGLPWAARHTSYCTMVFTMDCTTVSAPACRASPLPPYAPWCLQGCFSHIALLSLDCCCVAVFHLLKLVISEVLPPSLTGLALPSGWSICSSGSDMRKGSGSFSQRPPL